MEPTAPGVGPAWGGRAVSHGELLPCLVSSGNHQPRVDTRRGKLSTSPASETFHQPRVDTRAAACSGAPSLGPRRRCMLCTVAAKVSARVRLRDTVTAAGAHRAAQRSGIIFPRAGAKKRAAARLSAASAERPGQIRFMPLKFLRFLNHSRQLSAGDDADQVVWLNGGACLSGFRPSVEILRLGTH